MANTLRFKRGLASGLPTGVAGEPLFTTDTFDLYIGTGATNQRFQKYIASGTTSQYLRGDGSLATFPTNVITGTGASGQVAYWSGASTQAGSNNLFWDNTNGRLGIGTATPSNSLHITQSGSIATSMRMANTRVSESYVTSVYASGIYNATSGFTTSNAPFEIGLYTSTTVSANADGIYIGRSGLNFNFLLNRNGNLLLQNGGTFTDSGQRLQVTGDTLLKGSGNTSATTALLVENSDGSDIITARNDGSIFLTSNTGTRIFPQIGGDGSPAIGAVGLAFDGRAVTRTAVTSQFFFYAANNSTAAAQTLMNFQGGFVPTSGTANWNTVLINTTINQTGGANGITRGLYVNPTLTAAADWRSIEWSNNTGWGLYGAGTSNNFLAGSLGIGSTTNLTTRNLNIVKNITGNAIAYSIVNDSFVLSDVTNTATGFFNGINTQNATFTLSSYVHYDSQQGTIGASSTITNQFGFRAAASLTTGTNIFGFRGDIASGTGRWNLFMNGTAANYMAGSLGIGSTSLTGINLRISKNITGAVAGYGVLVDSQINSDVNSAVNIFNSLPSTQAASFNIGSLIHFIANQGTQGAGNTISNQYGFLAQAGLTGASNNYGFFGNIPSGTNRYNFYAGGTALNYFNGNTIMGTLAADSGEKLQVNGTMRVTGASTFGGNLSVIKNSGSPSIINVTDGTNTTSTEAYFQATAGTTQGFLLSWGQTKSAYKILGAGDVALYKSNTAGDVALFNDASSGSIKMAAGGSSTAHFTIASTGAATFSSSVQAGGNLLLTNGTASSIGAINLIRTGTSPVASRLTFGTDGTGYSFVIGKNQAGTVTDLVTILDSGAANFSSSIQAATAIAIGTTPDTNKPFKILKNINATVGINFENTSTSSLAFSAIQMGTDVTGGTAFTNLVYGSSGITELGVFKPNGTSLINTGSGGLNFLAVSQPIRFFTSSGNGTLRASITNDGDFTQFNGTNPSASTTDAFRMYSADVVAGNAAPHFRTENGAVVKIYQETTAVGNSIISLGGGSSVLDDTTFDGYTLRQIVKALRNQGILA